MICPAKGQNPTTPNNFYSAQQQFCCMKEIFIRTYTAEKHSRKNIGRERLLLITLLLHWCNFFDLESTIATLKWCHGRHSKSLSLFRTSPLACTNRYNSTNFSLLPCTRVEVLASNLLFTEQFCHSDKECLRLQMRCFYFSSSQCWKMSISHSVATWHVPFVHTSTRYWDN